MLSSIVNAIPRLGGNTTEVLNVSLPNSEIATHNKKTKKKREERKQSRMDREGVMEKSLGGERPIRKREKELEFGRDVKHGRGQGSRGGNVRFARGYQYSCDQKGIGSGEKVKMGRILIQGEENDHYRQGMKSLCRGNLG